jgi:DNA-binding CsgD family transcriptional regulator
MGGTVLGGVYAMVLLDSRRRHVDVNGAYLSLLRFRRDQLIGQPIYRFVRGGPQLTEAQWKAQIAKHQFSGDTKLVAADGETIAVQFAGHTEIATGRRLILFVALSTSRWGPRFRRSVADGHQPEKLSQREYDVVRLVALGSTGPEIAEELRIAHNTVRTHTRNAMEKVGARSRAQLVAKALGEGLVL